MRLRNILVAGAIAISGVFSAVLVTEPVSAADKICEDTSIDEQLREAAGCNVGADNKAANHVVNIINVAIGFVALIAVIMIVIGGQRYVVSAGDPGKLKQAKDMIVYSVVAIVVAVLAFAIVSFVSGAITSDANTGGSSSETNNE